MLPRFFYPELPAEGGDIALPEALAHHAERVLRLRVGECVTLFDASGREAEAELLQLGRAPQARLAPAYMISREAPLHISLVQALATGDKMDWIVQKAVELGVARLQPVAAERCVLKLEGERAVRRVEHWRQVALAAAEQCGRNHAMEICPLLALPHWLAQATPGERWLLAPGAERLSQRARPQGPVAILVGPEGGWSARELAAAHSAGLSAVALGPRVLRTETAGLAASAAMLALWGDF